MASDVAIVGAGLAGLVAARRLRERGHDVVLLDDGRVAGGRLATRQLGAATADDGAQFFTVRGDRFARLVRRWRTEGCPIAAWTHGFALARAAADGPAAVADGTDGHPRYAVGGGMGTLAAHLARGLDVRLCSRVRAVRPAAGGWRVDTAGAPLQAAAVLCTAPVPESLALLAGGVEVDAALHGELSAVRYAACIALLAGLDRRPAVPAPGGVQFRAGPVSWLADNAAKGVSAAPALTVHAGGEWSGAHARDDAATVAAALLETVRDWLGDALPVATRITRWRYAQPVEPYPQRTAVVAADPPLLLAGDAFGGPKVEGAVLSGLAAADALLALLDGAR